jgi:hypothetical protein
VTPDSLPPGAAAESIAERMYSEIYCLWDDLREIDHPMREHMGTLRELLDAWAEELT